MVQVHTFIYQYDDGTEANGEDIDEEDIPVPYQTKVALMRECGIEHHGAKILALYIHAFPIYSQYFGGVYVAS